MTERVEALMRLYEKELREYVSLLASYGGKIRLTGPSDPEVLWNEHVVDCLFSVPLLPEKGSALDVGSGGGLPGMIWAICRPDLRITLLDSVRKKCGALRDMASALHLRNVEVACGRCEEYAAEKREAFQFAAGRAVAAADVLLEYLSPLAAVSGRLLAFKGPLYTEELQPLEGKWSRLGLSSPEVVSYSAAGKERFLILWTKNTPLSARFPRKVGVAERNKWWR